MLKEHRLTVVAAVVKVIILVGQKGDASVGHDNSPNPDFRRS